ncbi:MAG: HAD family hydrolase [Firmicutes bacterium]|nr:HAD family hydrolase [Bacillota bacterium]
MLLIFDLDDTLVVTHPIFMRLTEQFLDEMRGLGLWDEQLYPTLDAIDRGIIEQAGEYVPWAFPQAMRRTYTVYCEKMGVPYDEQQAAHFEELGGSFAGAYHPPVPGAHALLAALRAAGHCMLLLTQGGCKEQLFKVEQHDLGRYFDEVIVVGKKTVEVYREIIAHYGAEPGQTVVIGNSLKSEVAPALAVGAQAIHLQVDIAWAYEDAEVAGEYRQVRTLAEVGALLGVDIDGQPCCGRHKIQDENE